MGSRIRCFWLEPTEDVEMRLRRYVFSTVEKCATSGFEYHNADVSIGRVHRSKAPDVHGDCWPHDDPRWPATCACGYTFQPPDQWQFNPDTLYRRADTDDLVTLAAAPVGAMWNADWLIDADGYSCVGGVVLMVKTPGGEWCVDGPAYNGGNVHPRAWTRSGAIPDVTAQPSIAMPRYHGFLRNGWLEEC